MKWRKKFLPKIKGKFLIFFILTLLLSTIYPFFLNSKTGIFILHILISLVSIAGIELINYNRKIFIGGLIWGSSCIVLTWGTLFFPQVWILSILWSLFLFIFYSVIAIYIIKLVVVGANKKVTTDTILGAISGYLMIALAWGMLFYLVELIQPNSFNFPVGINPSPDLFIYFSHITISSVGYGEITPNTPLTRALSALLAMVGQLYLTVDMAVIIGIYLSDKKQNK